MATQIEEMADQELVKEIYIRLGWAEWMTNLLLCNPITDGGDLDHVLQKLETAYNHDLYSQFREAISVYTNGDYKGVGSVPNRTILEVVLAVLRTNMAFNNLQQQWEQYE